MERAANFCRPPPAADRFARYFCETTAVLCEPYCAVTELFATLAPVAWEIVAMLPVPTWSAIWVLLPATAC
jgi:hypothetical protein